MALRNTLVFAAGGAVGLAVAWAGVRLIAAPPMSASAAPPAAAPVDAGVPLASAAEPASIADIQRLTSDFERAFALLRLASRRDVAGIESLLDEAHAIEPSSELVPALSILYARFADLDPAAAVRHILARSPAADPWLDVVFHAWAHSDLDAALRGFETLNADQRAIARAAILRAGHGLPPEERAELVARLPPQDAAAALASDERIADDPARAWQHVLRRQAGHSRWNELRRAIYGWARTDPLAALDAIESAAGIDLQSRADLRHDVVSAWASAEPRAALEWAITRPDAQSRSDIVGTALYSWANEDPRAAAQWLDAQADPALLLREWPSVAIHFAERHPEEAADWLLTLPADAFLASRTGDGRMLMWMETLVDNAPERAAGLLARFADADSRDTAERALIRRWTAADPNAAMAWLDRHTDADPARREALTSMLLETWARRDIAGAMRHLDRLTDPKTRDGTVLSMLRTALDFDVPLAESLFDRLATDDARRDGAAALYERLAQTDPARAERYR